MTDTPKTLTALLADQNDQFRRHVPAIACMWRGRVLHGEMGCTPGVLALRSDHLGHALDAVRAYDSFAADDHRHDAGEIHVSDGQGLVRLRWRLDYYDLDRVNPSADPANPGRTRRVLTLMLASEA